MHAVLDWLNGLSAPVVHLVVAALLFAQDAMFIGFVLPGGTASVVGCGLARQGTVDVRWPPSSGPRQPRLHPIRRRTTCPFRTTAQRRSP